MCQVSSLPYSDKWWDHVPLPVVEDADTKALWDFNIFMDRHISARRPDIVFIDKNAKTVWVIDVAVPADRRVKDKETEKIDKYQELCLEIQQLWNMRTIVIPIVVGALGVVSTAFKHHTSRLKLPNWIMPLLQKAALLGTARILRQTLQLSGFS